MNFSHVKRRRRKSSRTMEKALKSNLMVNDYLQGFCLLTKPNDVVIPVVILPNEIRFLLLDYHNFQTKRSANGIYLFYIKQN